MKEDIFAHWDTTPVKVKTQYIPENYTPQEWMIKKIVERRGDAMWEQSGYESEFESFDM